MQNDGLRASEQALAEQKKRAKRERAAEKLRKKTRDKHRAQGDGLSSAVLATSCSDVKDFVLSLLPELGTMDSKRGELR